MNAIYVDQKEERAQDSILGDTREDRAGEAECGRKGVQEVALNAIVMNLLGESRVVDFAKTFREVKKDSVYLVRLIEAAGEIADSDATINIDL